MVITFDTLIGKTILIGLTYVDKNGELIKKSQLFGKVIRAGEDIGIEILINKADEKTYLPPDLSAIEVAAEGTYSLKSTGETVVNPDYISYWRINV